MESLGPNRRRGEEGYSEKEREKERAGERDRYDALTKTDEVSS